MYISRILIENFRCFGEVNVEFHPGVNVIIGENNAGKTALLAALGLVFAHGTRRRPQFHDFFQGITSFSAPPAITVRVTIGSHNDGPRDRALVAMWLTKLEEPWEATLTFQFFLPDKDREEFIVALGPSPTRERFYKQLLESLPKYVSRLYGGDPVSRMSADAESLSRFRYQYLDALRDVASDMYTGQNPLLKDMLQTVLDVGATKEGKADRRQKFSEMASGLHEHVRGRLELDRLFELVADTGAADGGVPDVDGTIEEAELMAALRLVVRRDGMLLPVIFNGLGYNNLVYIALMLSKLDFDARADRAGDNALVFPILVVEEPEAHLHPALQYKLLKYLRRRIGKNIAEEAESRQVFITTHSTQITSACDLDDIICLNTPEVPGGSPRVSYPGRVFDHSTAEGRTSKGYVQRFLDATKSSMLFAKSVIFVEGIAEQLVLPQLAELLDRPLEDSHVALVAVGGSTAKHFLPLFGACAEEQRPFALRRRVACLVDADPSRKEKGKEGAKFKACHPYEIDASTDLYEYQPLSPVVSTLRTLATYANNVQIFTNAKTLEYDLAYANPRVALLVTDEQAWADHLRAFCASSDPVHHKIERALDADTVAALETLTPESDRLPARFATYYLNCVGDGKGAHSLALSLAIRAAGKEGGLRVPKYLADALEFVCSPAPDAADRILDA